MIISSQNIIIIFSPGAPKKNRDLVPVLSEILISARSRSIAQAPIITVGNQSQTTVDLFQLLQRNYSYCQERWQRLLAINDSPKTSNFIIVGTNAISTAPAQTVW